MIVLLSILTTINAIHQFLRGCLPYVFRYTNTAQRVLACAERLGNMVVFFIRQFGEMMLPASGGNVPSAEEVFDYYLTDQLLN